MGIFGDDDSHWYDPTSWDYDQGAPRILKYGAAIGAGTFLGGPAGGAAAGGAVYAKEQSDQKSAAGQQAAQDAMSQSRSLLDQQRRESHIQRQKDLQRALAYFGPSNQLAQRMYGTAMPAPYMTDEQMAAARRDAFRPTATNAAQFISGPDSSSPQAIAAFKPTAASAAQFISGPQATAEQMFAQQRQMRARGAGGGKGHSY